MNAYKTVKAVVIQVVGVAELDHIFMTMEGCYAVQDGIQTRHCNMTQLCIDYGLNESTLYASEAFQEGCRNGLQEVEIDVDEELEQLLMRENFERLQEMAGPVEPQLEDF